jgi:hypothetical protein
MAQRRVATLLNCREWTTIIEALNTHGLIVALSMHLSNLASPTTVLLITQSVRSCQRGTRIRHADIIGGSAPLQTSRVRQYAVVRGSIPPKG